MTGAANWVRRLTELPAPGGLPLPGCQALAIDEKLIVAAIRQIVITGRIMPAVAAALEQGCGAAGAAVHQALLEWLTLLADSASRQIAVGAPTHCCPSPDEVAMLAIIDAARRGDFTCAHAVLGGLVRRDAVDNLAHAAETLGETIVAAGMSLTPRRFRPRDR